MENMKEMPYIWIIIIIALIIIIIQTKDMMKF